MDTSIKKLSRCAIYTRESTEHNLDLEFNSVAGEPGGGRAFLKRFRLRAKDRDPEVNEKVAPAQRAAIGQVGRSARASLRLSEGYPTANAGRQRQQ